MTTLVDILARNQGSVLTPELIWGVARAHELAEPGGVCAVSPSEVPATAYAQDPRLVTDDRERVGEWIAGRVGQLGGWGGFGAIGLLDEAGEELVAAGLINNITPTNATAHVAIDNRHGLKRCLIHAFFDYAFNQLGLERLTGYVSEDNPQALRFDLHLGYEHEFVIPRGNNGDVYQLVMWRDKCRWLK